MEGRCIRVKRLQRLEALLNNPKATAGLKLELAIADSIGRPLCQSTYMLEGDGPLMLIAYDIMDFVFSLFADRMEQLSFCGVHDAIRDCLTSLCAMKDDPTRNFWNLF